MPINVFGNSSNNNNNDNKIDTSLFVKKPYLRNNYIESNIEEDINLKNQDKIKNLINPIDLFDACNKNYIDNTIDESSLLRLDPNETLDLNNQDSILLNSTKTSPITIIELPTKAYIDSLHEENERSRRNLGIDFYNESSDLVKNNQDNDFNNYKLTNINSITINNNPTEDNHVSNKKYIDNELDKNTIVRFNQTLQNYLKVSVVNDIYNLTKYNKYYLTVLTVIKYPNSGGYLLQKWNIECNDRNGQGKIQNFIRSSKTSSPTSDSGATNLPPIGDSFMYIESSSNNSGPYTYVILTRTDIIQISNITFYYNRYSSTDENLRSMGRFRIELLKDNNSWETQYTIEKNTQYSLTSTEWTLLSLDFANENYGIRLVYDRIDTAHADMCFSNITITHSVY